MTVMGQGPRMGFKVPPKRILDIRDTAMRVRKQLGVSGPKFDAEQVLERLGTFGVTVDIVADDDPELPPGIEACWLPDVVTLVIKQSVYVAACRRHPRALFTIAHELGHLALAHRRAFNRDAGGRVQLFEDSEWQANTFAAEFLMPCHLIKEHGCRGASDIQQLFGVSAPAALARYNKLNGIRQA